MQWTPTSQSTTHHELRQTIEHGVNVGMTERNHTAKILFSVADDQCFFIVEAHRCDAKRNSRNARRFDHRPCS
eukprot:scaffold166488_cov28-Tisochrysis_lutea.AAC.2